MGHLHLLVYVVVWDGQPFAYCQKRAKPEKENKKARGTLRLTLALIQSALALIQSAQPLITEEGASMPCLRDKRLSVLAVWRLILLRVLRQLERVWEGSLLGCDALMFNSLSWR